MSKIRVQILIPTLNNVMELDKTVQSIWNQDFEQEDIYTTIVDFGSTDGTYEKALAYPKKNLGIYRKIGQLNKRQMVAEAGRILEFVYPGGEYCFSILLYPGDIMYPECIKKCVEAFVKNYALNPITLICETDIWNEDGTIRKQSVLFEADKIIDGCNEIIEYVKRGYQHYIFAMNLEFAKERYKANSEINEQRFWNKLARIGNERNVIYLKDTLTCVKEITYEDELEEILYRWEAIISIERFYQSKFGNLFDEKFSNEAVKNISKYALWRSWLLYKKGEEKKKIENCFMISSVIYPSIQKENLYQTIKSVLIDGKKEKCKEIELIFINEK